MRWKPKQWPRPGSRRTREAQARARNPECTITDVLKEVYDDGWTPVRPRWAVTAHKFGWMTSSDFYAIKPVMVESEARRRIRLMYESSPLFKAAMRYASEAGVKF